MREININHFEKGIVGKYNHDVKKIHAKWKRVFEGCKPEEAIMLNNVARYLIDEAALTEQGGTGAIGGYSDFVMKMVKRIYAKLIGPELVSVQPMLAPQSRIFYMDPQVTTGTTGDYTSMYDLHYDNGGYDVSKGAYVLTYSNRFSGYEIGPVRRGIYGEVEVDIRYSGGMESLASLQHYIHKLVEVDYDISSSDFAINPGQLIDGTINSTAGAGGVEDTVANATFSASTTGSPLPVHSFVLWAEVASQIPKSFKFSGSTDGISWVELLDIQTPNFDRSVKFGSPTISSHTEYFSTAVAYDYFSLDAVIGPSNLSIGEIALYSTEQASGVSFTINPTTWTEDFISANTIVGRFFYDGTEFESTTADALPVVTSVWRDYSGTEAVTGMQQVQLNITGSDISAVSRHLKASFTVELEVDFNEYNFGVDLVDEYAEIMSTEIAAEIDREIIRDLIRVAPYKSEWWYDQDSMSAGTLFFSGDQRELSGVSVSGVTADKMAKHSLLTKINIMENVIRKANIYHGTNWIVCSTSVGALIEGMDEFHNDDHELQDPEQINRVGKLMSRMNVYIDPYLPEEILLMGYKGDGWDAGYVYAPYTVLKLEAPDPDALWQKSIFFANRYGKKVISNKKYGVIYCTFPTDPAYTPVNGV